MVRDYESHPQSFVGFEHMSVGGLVGLKCAHVRSVGARGVSVGIRAFLLTLRIFAHNTASFHASLLYAVSVQRLVIVGRRQQSHYRAATLT